MSYSHFQPHVFSSVLEQARQFDVPLRVSSSAFARVRDEAGKNAVVLNKNRLERGIRRFSPIGGALEVKPEGLSTLHHCIGLTRKQLYKQADLRFLAEEHHLQMYLNWFLKREGREQCPLREMREELVTEFSLLELKHLAGVSAQFAGFFAEVGICDRFRPEGEPSFRIVEVHDVVLSSAVLHDLQQAAHDHHELLRFVSDEEILKGNTDRGEEIASITRCLIEPLFAS